jgi:carbonic anhydrase
MKKIMKGLFQFQREVYPARTSEFKRLASGQSPEVLFITCADSRVVPALITQTNPGDLFICRNAGNIVPSYGDVNGGVSATIEYAVMALKVRDIVVCGHSDCGAMKGILHPELVASMPNVAAWLRHADSARQVIAENYSHLQGADLLKAAIEENVLAQLENLKTHPSVAARLRKGELALHGWVYDIERGEVTAYAPGANRFVPLAETALYEEAVHAG